MKRIVYTLSICLVSVIAGTAVAEPELSIALSRNEISVAEEIDVFGTVEWDHAGLLTDVYLAVMDDAGSLRFFYPGCAAPQPCPTPYLGQLFLPQGFAAENYFLDRFTGEMFAFSSVPATYYVLLALTRRGYLDMVCEPAFAEIRITPVQPRTWRDSGPNYVTFDYIDHRWLMTEVNLEVNHTWSAEVDGQTWSGSDIDYFVQQGRWELNDVGPTEFTWHDEGGSPLGLWVYLTVYEDYASALADGYDRQTLPPDGARIEEWSLYTTLRP